jgi:type IV pilus biogenesis protein CpaD/CtpE
MDPHNTATITTWLLFFAAMFAVTGCTPEADRLSTIEVPKENKVEFLHLDHPVLFTPGSSQLAAGEDKSLATFLATVHPAGGDEVTIAATGSAKSGLQAQRRADITHRLQHFGVRARAVEPASGAALPGNDEVLVQVGRYVVTGPRCPDWSAPEAGDFTNTPPSNFGCATTTNLGAGSNAIGRAH